MEKSGDHRHELGGKEDDFGIFFLRQQSPTGGDVVHLHRRHQFIQPFQLMLFEVKFDHRLGIHRHDRRPMIIDGVEWDFSKNDTDGYVYLNPAGKLVKFENPKVSNVFLDDAMSNRGHIWNKTIPLLGKHAFMGSGANTYMFEVPQEDYISQNYVYGANSYDVKAHSWYLQQWVETGLIGTLALLVFLFWYLVQSIRIYRRVDLHESISWVGFGLFAAVLVYMIAGIANDSNVCTAPVFWGMLGLGLAVNRMLVKKENLFVKETAVSAESDTAVKQSIPKAAESAKADTAQTVQNTQGAGVTESSVRKKSSKKQSRKQRKNQK